MDPFDTLGIEPRFAIDLKLVEKRHRELSRALHPDRYVGRPAGERRMALSRAIEVNEAWRVVRDPVRRGEALLRRAGMKTEEQSATARPELLMEMMEQREALAQARENRDMDQLNQLTEQMRAREQEIERRLVDELDGAERKGLEAVATLGELRYVRRFLEEASAAEDELT